MKKAAILIVVLGSLALAGRSALSAQSVGGAFQSIEQRNIFSPVRGVPEPPIRQVHQVDYVALNGVMTYENRRVAFFEQSGSGQRRRVVQPDDLINGFKVADISSQAVKLVASGGEVLNLIVGEKITRQDGGPWKQASGEGVDSEVEQKLMKQRLQELQN